MSKQRSKVLLVDMTLAGGNIVRQLSEGRLYWFLDMEIVKSSGNSIRSSTRYFTVDKAQFPKYEDVLQLIRLKFERSLPL